LWKAFGSSEPERDADSLRTCEPEKKNDTKAFGAPGKERLLRRYGHERSTVKPEGPKEESQDACDGRKDERVEEDASEACQGKQEAVEDQQLSALGTWCKA
jgi:hypothetical protein